MLRWVRLVGSAVLAAAVGLAVGVLTRSASGPRSRRPEAVERMLRALEAADRRGEAVAGGAPGGAALLTALQEARSEPALDAPSEAEVELVRLVLAGDAEALLAFGTGERPCAPRARALLWLAQHGAREDLRRRAREMLRARYPDAWIVADGGLR